MSQTSPAFVHLQSIRIIRCSRRVPDSDLVKRTKAIGLETRAIRITGAVGVIEFLNECKKEGINRFWGWKRHGTGASARRTRRRARAAYTCVIWQDSGRVQESSRSKQYRVSRGVLVQAGIDKERSEYSKGFICHQEAGLGGEIPASYQAQHEGAKEVARHYLTIFGPDRFYSEVQKHIRAGSGESGAGGAAKKLGVGLVGTNDVPLFERKKITTRTLFCAHQHGEADSRKRTD